MCAQVSPEAFVLIWITNRRAIDNDDVAVFAELGIVLSERSLEYLLVLGKLREVRFNDTVVTQPSSGNSVNIVLGAESSFKAILLKLTTICLFSSSLLKQSKP